MDASSSSKSSFNGPNSEDEDSELVLPLQNEAVEIERLHTVERGTAEPSSFKTTNNDRVARIKFVCSECKLQEMVHYYGRKPPFAKGILYREQNYVMRDPFQAPPAHGQSKPEYYVSLGADCTACNRTVCKDPSCSFFYTRTFCLQCAKAQAENWPVEAQHRVLNQIQAKGKQDKTASK